MIDADAIRLIQDTALQATQANRLSTDCPAIVLPEKYGVHSLEKFGQGRYRYRGAFATTSLKDFATYARQHQAGEGFIDTDKMTARIFFNLGTSEAPGHGDWYAALSLKSTAAYDALRAVDKGTKFSQRDLIDWIEDWAPVLEPFDDAGNAMPLAAAVAGIRKVTIKEKSERTHDERDFGATQSAFADIEANGAQNLPAGLRFHLAPYADLSERKFVLRLSLLTGGDKPLFTLRWMQREQQIEAISTEFKDVLTTLLDGKASLVIGSFNPG